MLIVEYVWHATPSLILCLRFLPSRVRIHSSSMSVCIGKWGVGAVTGMQEMSDATSDVNRQIGNWTVISVSTMHGMFSRTSDFNQPIYRKLERQRNH